MSSPEKFVNYLTNQPVTLTNLTGSNFGASGANHSTGLVPDPGSTPGSGKFLREDATFAQVAYSQVTGTPALTTPTYQSFTTGSASYTPTSGNVIRIKVRMCGGGGGGGAQATNNGANGTDTSFGSWTAIHGTGGSAVAGAVGTGGIGGVNGTGTLIVRFTGGSGGGAGVTLGGIGGVNPFGGGGGNGGINLPGISAAANTGAGGGGGGAAIGVTGGSGGGAGEYVEFVVPSPGTISYTVGVGGNGGAAGGQAGGNGASGIILIEEQYV